MVEEILKLLRLEEIDGRLRAARATLTAFGPEREAAVRVAAADREAVSEAESALAEREHEHRRLETELQDADRLVTKLDAQVYEVTSKQAMEAIQKELEAARGRRSGLEDGILELLDAIESASAALAAAEETARTRTGEHAQEETSRAAREVELHAEVERLEAARTEACKGVERDVLSRYEDSRRKAWPVLARVEAKSCPACRIMIPPQKRNEIGVASKLVTCGSCHRILYGDKVAASY